MISYQTAQVGHGDGRRKKRARLEKMVATPEKMVATPEPMLALIKGVVSVGAVWSLEPILATMLIIQT